MTIDEAMILLARGQAGRNSTTQSALAAIVGTRVYATEAPENAVDPKIVMKVIAGPKDYAHDGDTGLAMPRFQFDCYGQNALSALQTFQALAKNISGFRGTVGGVQIQSLFVENRHTFDFPSPNNSQNAERGYALDALVTCVE